VNNNSNNNNSNNNNEEEEEEGEEGDLRISGKHILIFLMENRGLEDGDLKNRLVWKLKTEIRESTTLS
jgi:hypothetical protein